MNRADLVKRFLNELAGRPDLKSAEQLKRLEGLPALAEWASKLREARSAQQVVRRDATYERPMWPQVCAALQQGTPSSPTQITAVVNDTIDDLKEQVRRSDLNLNHQYWNADSHKKATTPRRAISSIARSLRSCGGNINVHNDCAAIQLRKATEHSACADADAYFPIATAVITITKRNPALPIFLPLLSGNTGRISSQGHAQSRRPFGGAAFDIGVEDFRPSARRQAAVRDERAEVTSKEINSTSFFSQPNNSRNRRNSRACSGCSGLVKIIPLQSGRAPST
jgi:hypothetical protein